MASVLSVSRTQAQACDAVSKMGVGKVISNIADTALAPEIAVAETISVLNGLFG